MAQNTEDNENGNGQRKARGTSAPQERLARAQATLRGLAADMMTATDPVILDAYRAVLQDMQTLTTAFDKQATPTS